MIFPYEEFDLSDVRTYPLESRTSKARVNDFARADGASRRGSPAADPVAVSCGES